MNKIEHVCPVDGMVELDATWCEDGQVFRAECDACDTVFYKGKSSEYSIDQ